MQRSWPVSRRNSRAATSHSSTTDRAARRPVRTDCAVNSTLGADRRGVALRSSGRGSSSMQTRPHGLREAVTATQGLLPPSVRTGTQLDVIT
jgi:hypothetical protein